MSSRSDFEGSGVIVLATERVFLPRLLVGTVGGDLNGEDVDFGEGLVVWRGGEVQEDSRERLLGVDRLNFGGSLNTSCLTSIEELDGGGIS